MKEASGELNLTVITIIAIGVVIGFFYAFWPTIKGSIENQFNDVNCTYRDENGKCLESNELVQY